MTAKQTLFSGDSSSVTNRVVAALKIHMKAVLEKAGDRPRSTMEVEQQLQGVKGKGALLLLGDGHGVKGKGACKMRNMYDDVDSLYALIFPCCPHFVIFHFDRMSSMPNRTS